jgi:hypothetical protein
LNIQNKIDEQKQTMSWVFFEGGVDKKIEIINMLESKLGIQLNKDDFII